MQAAACASKVELRISCKGLQDKDVLSKSDPMVAVFHFEGSRWVEIGRTEVVKNCLNPLFSKSIIMDYYFEISQKLRFDVYDIDNATKKLDDDDFLGRMECTLGQIVASATLCQNLSLKSRKPAGTITVSAEELSGSNDIVHLTFRANKLDNKDFFGKSDPYLEVCKCSDTGSLQVIHRTEVIKNNLNPQWRPFEVRVQALCNNDYNRPIKIMCYDWDSDGSHDFIGEVNTTLKEMVESTKNIEKTWDCVNPKKKQKKRKYVNSGTITLCYTKVEKAFSFVDYVLGGCQINFLVGIDFTASNGDPRNPQSLHYMNPYSPNEYLKAITSVGEIIQDYDTDKLFPAFGFGARIPPSNDVSFKFALNFDESNPYCNGIQGVVAAYQRCLQCIQLYGPTYVAPIINDAAGLARGAGNQKGTMEYFVLLLITDGVLSDMFQAVEAIVQASNLPLSIIIVGVGTADFTDMNTLDGDDGRLKGRTTYASRDIVQFVPFRDFKNRSPAELAKCVLAEVPQQVVEYFKVKGIHPNQRQAGQTAPPPPSQTQPPYHPGQGPAPPPSGPPAPYPSSQGPYPSGPPPPGQTPYPSGPPPPHQGSYPSGPPPPHHGSYPSGPPPPGQPQYPGQAPYPSAPPGNAPYPAPPGSGHANPPYP